MSTDNKQGSVLEGINKTQDLYIDNKNNNFEFISSLYREGNLHFAKHDSIWQSFNNRQGNASYMQQYTKLATEEEFTHLRSMIKTLQEVYPDQWNLEYYYDNQVKKVVFLGFALHFPTMWISNNTGAKHLMRDVYSFSPIMTSNKPGFLRIVTLCMTRLTTTVNESNSSYIHSHQPSGIISRHRNSWGGISNFSEIYKNMCLGNSNQGVTRANTIFSDDPSTDNFISCLLHIRSTLRYESLEGGPHITFQNIRNNSNTNQPRNFSRSVGSNSVEKIGNFLLKYALKEDPNLLLKFDLKYHPFLSKSLIFQDSLKLKEILDQSFRKLITVAPDPTSKIVLERTSTGASQSYSLAELSSLFSYKTNSGLKQVDTARFYLPEQVPGEEQAPQDRIVEDYENRLMFRGTLRNAKVIEPSTSTGETYTKLYPSDTNIELDPSYFEMIKQTLTQKLIKNVFLQQEEVTKA